MNKNEFCKELVECAAVSVAAIEDVLGISRQEVLLKISNERDRQESKWGPQSHDPNTWLAILGEEVGESCQAALRWQYDAIKQADLLKSNNNNSV